MSNVQHGYWFQSMVTFFFLSFLEQDKHVTKCSSYIETIQPSRIMTKYLPLYETKPPSWLVWQDGSNLDHSEKCQSEWSAFIFLFTASYSCKLTQLVALIKRANADYSWDQRAYIVKGIEWQQIHTLYYRANTDCACLFFK